MWKNVAFPFFLLDVIIHNFKDVKLQARRFFFFILSLILSSTFFVFQSFLLYQRKVVPRQPLFMIKIVHCHWIPTNSEKPKYKTVFCFADTLVVSKDNTGQMNALISSYIRYKLKYFSQLHSNLTSPHVQLTIDRYFVNFGLYWRLDIRDISVGRKMNYYISIFLT